MLYFPPSLFSSHNWNSLFISSNAVADAMAERYQTTKDKILDSVSNNQSIDQLKMINKDIRLLRTKFEIP